MKCILFIFFSLSLCEDVYPHFTDMNKQMKFEEERIYTNESSGERTIVSGGGSYPVLTNPFFIHLNESPQYISMNRPINTKIQYWYEFEIIRNNIKLTELDFLEIIGLEDKAFEIYDSYLQDVYNYNLIKPLVDDIIIEDFIVNIGFLGHFFGKKEQWGYPKSKLRNNIKYHDLNAEMALNMYNILMVSLTGLVSLTEGGIPNPDFNWNIVSIPLLIQFANYIKYEKTIKVKNWKYPEYRGISYPQLKQTLSSSQIKALADSYNRKIYTEIKNSN